MKRKLINNSGVTLIEILIGIVISVLMMGAMYTAYNAVNSSYSKVTDRAKISAQGRDLVTMIVRDIRNAGFRYFGDNIQINLLEHSPILIKKPASNKFKKECDSIDIVFGGGHFDSKQNFIYKKYKSSYHCERSKIEDRAKGKNNSGTYDTVDGFAIFKTVKVWENGKWANPNTDNDDYTFEKQKVADYIEDMVFNPIDDKGVLIDPPPSPTNINKNKLYNIKTVDVAISIRSTKPFFRTKADNRNKAVMNETKRQRKDNDRYFRDTIIVTAFARNLGIQ